jgi:hypothetical protein
MIVMVAAMVTRPTAGEFAIFRDPLPSGQLAGNEML